MQTYFQRIQKLLEKVVLVQVIFVVVVFVVVLFDAIIFAVSGDTFVMMMMMIIIGQNVSIPQCFDFKGWPNRSKIPLTPYLFLLTSGVAEAVL